MRDHLVIGDTQCKPGVPTDHLEALGNFIVEKQPDVIVHIGDNWDMESLSSYDEDTYRMEGRRIEADIEAGNEGIRILDDAIRSVPDYDPERIFILGNHEARIERFLNDNPKFKGFLGYDDFELDEWDVVPFLEIATVDGIRYAHYFANPFSGRPYGGSVVNRLNKLKFSHVQGHIQKLEYHKDYLNDGQVLNALTCGAFHIHSEDYKGPQGGNHFRGVCYLHGVMNGDYDLETVSLGRLMSEYK